MGTEGVMDIEAFSQVSCMEPMQRSSDLSRKKALDG